MGKAKGNDTLDFQLWASSLVNGLIGGTIYILIQNLGWNDNKEVIRRLMFGIIAGYITHLLGHFDPLTTITAGYFGLDLAEALINNEQIKDNIKKIKNRS